MTVTTIFYKEHKKKYKILKDIQIKRVNFVVSKLNKHMSFFAAIKLNKELNKLTKKDFK